MVAVSIAEPTVVKVVSGLIVSAFLTIGGVSYTNKNVNDTQDVRIDQLETAGQLIGTLSSQLALTNQNIAVLNERLNNLKERLDEQKSN